MDQMTPLEMTAIRIDDLRTAFDAWTNRYNEGGDARSESLALLSLGEAHCHIIAAMSALNRI